MNQNTVASGLESHAGILAGNVQPLRPNHIASKRPAKTPNGSHDLTTALIARVKRLISERRVKPGEKLPTERHLAAEFGVNRASVRQALKALVAMGVLIQRVGDGTYLSPKACAVPALPVKLPRLTETLTISELFDFRAIVEPALVAKAALSRSEADIIALESAVAAMNEGIDLGLMTMAVNGDRMFCKRLWEASGDRLFCKMLAPIHQVISQSIEARLPLVRYKRMARGHRNVLDAVRSRDSVAASQAMESLLKITRKDLSDRLLMA